MKLLLITAYFPPEIGSASHLFYDMAESLISRSHSVKVITGFPKYNMQERPLAYRGKLIMHESMNGIRVHRWPVLSMPRRLMLGRALDHFFAAGSFFLGGLLAGRHDIVTVYSPPLPLGLSAWLLSRLRGSRFILNVQDLFPQSIIDLGLLKNDLIIKAFRAMERFIYLHADAITVHSEGNRAHVIGCGGCPECVHVVPNWVDTQRIEPGERLNTFRRDNNLGSKFIVSFAGVMGYSQALGSVIEAAGLLKEHKDILFLLVGDGVEKDGLLQQVTQLALSNVRFLPMQPRDRYPEVLAASDVCLVTLRKDVSTPVVPSKIPTIMAAARPMVASMPLAGDGPRLVEKAQCGLLVAPQDPQAIAKAILDLYQSPETREQLGANGRLYAEKHLSREVCVGKYERLFKEIAARRSS